MTEQEQLREKFYKNPIMDTLKERYPYRDYDLEFALMCDWYKTKKKRLPKAISAFRHWLSNTKPDMELQREIEFNKQMEEIKTKQQEYSKIIEEEQSDPKEIRKAISKLRRDLAGKLSYGKSDTTSSVREQ